MADVPPTPARVIIPLRRDTEAPQCPEVERCLLELVREPAPKLLEVIDTGLPSAALNRETTKQVVQTKLIANRRSCHRDYTVRVSLLSAGGPIAVGEGRERTTTVRVVRTFAPSGSVIDDNTATTVERVSPDTQTGTTTDVQVVDEPTVRTTTTTTVTVGAVRWERRMVGCVDPPEVWLPSSPRHLLGARYLRDSVAAALVVYQGMGGDWRVLVERRGGDADGVLSLVYTDQQDSLVVTAALSQDLRALYVCESRNPGGGGRVSTWYWYTVATEGWALYGQGLVPATAEDSAFKLPMRVDRFGRIGGYWGTRTDTTSEADSSGAGCQNSWDGYQINSNRVHYLSVAGGVYNLATGEVVADRTRRRGIVLASGDLVPLEEELVGGSYLGTWTSFIWHKGPGVYDPWTTQELSTRDGDHFDVPVLDGLWTKDLSRDFQASARFDGVWDPAVPPETISRVSYTYTFSRYLVHDGSISVAVTPGGWVTRTESATVTSYPDMDPYTYSTEGEGIVVDFCIYPVNWLMANRSLAETEVATHAILHPHDLGDAHAIHKSFSSVDTASGDTWTGALVEATEGADPEWRLFRNRVPVDPEACLGRPMDELHAIYWRA